MKNLHVPSLVISISLACVLAGCFGSGRAKSGWDEQTAEERSARQNLTDASVEGQPAIPSAKSEKASAVEAKESVTIIAEKFLDKILKGLNDNDYAIYSTDFTDSLKLVNTSPKFSEEVKGKKNTIGDYVSRSFLAELTKGDRKFFLWKAKFSKTEDDILIRVVVEKIDGAYKVSSLWIQ